VIALARVIAIALDPVHGLVAAVGAELAAGAAERAPHPLMARCAFCRQVTSLVRTDTKGLGTTVLGAIRVLARLQDPRLLAARHGGERMEGTEELQKWGRTSGTGGGRRMFQKPSFFILMLRGCILDPKDASFDLNS